MVTQYMRLGYVSQCGCRESEALKWVTFVCGMATRWAEDKCHIQVNVGDDSMEMWIDSGYCWENELLLKRIA